MLPFFGSSLTWSQRHLNMWWVTFVGFLLNPSWILGHTLSDPDVFYLLYNTQDSGWSNFILTFESTFNNEITLWFFFSWCQCPKSWQRGKMRWKNLPLALFFGKVCIKLESFIPGTSAVNQVNCLGLLFLLLC